MRSINNKCQVTIFIIIAILIVVVIALFFLLKGKISIPGLTPRMPNIQADIESCTKKAVLQAVDIMLPQGGYIQPKLYKLYENNKVAYLCYNNNYYQPCINQQPLYLENVANEIKKFISSKIEDCFYTIEQDYQDKQYSIDMGATNIEVGLNPRQVEVTINKKIEISKNEENRKIDKIVVNIDSPIYDLAVIANEIVNQEVKFCYFEYLGFQLLYPSFSIGKMDIDGNTKIYNIKEKATGKEFLFAVRSCAMPAGI